MTITDTITSMQQHTQEAYDAIEALGGDLPDNLNLENLADAIQSTAKATPIGPWGRVIYVAQTKAVGLSLQSQEEFNALATNGNLNSTITIQGNTFAKSKVVSFTFGSNFPTTIPDYFLYSFTGLGVGGLSVTVPSGVTTIGNHFMDGCIAYNYAMTLPATITAIGTYFRAYNGGVSVTNLSNTNITTIPDYFHYNNYRLTSSSAVVIPDGVVSIGNYFLGVCRYFNAPVILPATIKTIGSNFLSKCHNFNSSLTINGTITSIGDYFLKSAYSFNQSLTIEGEDGTIGTYFLSEAYLGSSTNSVNLTGSWSSIGNGFAMNSGSLNVPITIAGNNLVIGNSFLYGCMILSSNIRFTGTVRSIGGFFMAYCPNLSTVFGNPSLSTYSALATIESIGDYCMHASKADTVYTPPALTSLGFGFLSRALVQNVYHYSPLLESIPSNFCYLCHSSGISPKLYLGGWVKSVGNNFLAGSNFVSISRLVYDSSTQEFSSYSSLSFSSITQVGTNFLSNCTSLTLNPNWPLGLTGLTQLPAGFMYNCTANIGQVNFSKDITLLDSYANTSQPMGVYYGTDGAPAYVIGVTIGGPGAAKVLAGLPNSSSGYYRNLKAVSNATASVAEGPELVNIQNESPLFEDSVL